MSKSKIEIDIPFTTPRLAEIAYHTLRVDIEPERSRVRKDLKCKENFLCCTFTGESLKQLRTAVTNHFEKIDLIVETAEVCGKPVSVSYDHFTENVGAHTGTDS